MQTWLDWRVTWALARRTFRQSIHSPVAYMGAILFFGAIGGIFGLNFFIANQASIDSIGGLAPWILWFVVPALTMGLFAEEIRSGTFEHLSTLPIRDWEIVLGKFLGFAMLALALIMGLLFFPIMISFVVDTKQGLDWGATGGILFALYLLTLLYGAIGLFASSLTKNQIVAYIIGMIICTVFFMTGMFYTLFPGFLGLCADFFGVLSHIISLSRGVFDFRDVLYFVSMTIIFLYLTVQKLSTRRF